MTSDLLDLGVPLVAWLKPPVPDFRGISDDLREIERWDVMEDVIDEVTAVPDDGVVSVDLDEWMNAAGYADTDDFRFDGLHITDEKAFEVADRWLMPTLLELAYERQPDT